MDANLPIDEAQSNSDTGNQRNRITPDSFKVSKALMGLPLASPSRRGLALLIDLICIGLISSVGFIGFALMIALVIYRSKYAPEGTMGRWVTPVLFVVLLLSALIGGAAYWVKVSFDDVKVITNEQGINEVADKSLLMHLVQIRMADSEQEYNQVISEVTAQLSEKNMSAEEIDAYVAKLIDAAAETGQELAVPSGESAEQDQKQESETAKLESEIAKLKTQIDDLTAENQQIGIVAWVEGIIKDLGLSFGWAALYFSAFWALFAGRSPGKWVMGIRVIQLNGEPLTYWQAFGRYGGYAAGFATGLLGFGQIYWDKNRQAIHDKIAETVVIKDRG